METPQITPQPSSTLVYFNLGNIYLEKGYMENAQLLLTSMQVTLLLLLLPPPPLMFQQMYVNVITLDPLYRGAFNNLGNALKEADFFDHAIRCPRPAVYLLLLLHLPQPLCFSEHGTPPCASCPPTSTFLPTSCTRAFHHNTLGSLLWTGTCACICATGPTVSHGLQLSGAP